MSTSHPDRVVERIDGDRSDLRPDGQEAHLNRQAFAAAAELQHPAAVEEDPGGPAGQGNVDRLFAVIFAEGYDVRPQLPLALGDDSEPEPDIAVVPGAWRDYSHSHPTTALLIVEVADNSLLHDRKRKTRLYAQAGIPEYWIDNLVDWCLEVYRDSKDGVYTSRAVLREGDSVSPLSRPEASIPVADLFPRR
jgi:hypothetical protein